MVVQEYMQGNVKIVSRDDAVKSGEALEAIHKRLVAIGQKILANKKERLAQRP